MAGRHHCELRNISSPKQYHEFCELQECSWAGGAVGFVKRPRLWSHGKWSKKQRCLTCVPIRLAFRSDLLCRSPGHPKRFASIRCKARQQQVASKDAGKSLQQKPRKKASHPGLHLQYTCSASCSFFWWNPEVLPRCMKPYVPTLQRALFWHMLHLRQQFQHLPAVPACSLPAFERPENFHPPHTSQTSPYCNGVLRWGLAKACFSTPDHVHAKMGTSPNRG